MEEKSDLPWGPVVVAKSSCPRSQRSASYRMGSSTKPPIRLYMRLTPNVFPDSMK